MNAMIDMTRVNLPERGSIFNLAAMWRGDVGLSPAMISISNRLGCVVKAFSSWSVMRCNCMPSRNGSLFYEQSLPSCQREAG